MRAASTSDSTPSWSSGSCMSRSAATNSSDSTSCGSCPSAASASSASSSASSSTSSWSGYSMASTMASTRVFVAVEHDELTVLVPGVFDAGALERLGQLGSAIVVPVRQVVRDLLGATVEERFAVGFVDEPVGLVLVLLPHDERRAVPRVRDAVARRRARRWRGAASARAPRTRTRPVPRPRCRALRA